MKLSRKSAPNLEVHFLDLQTKISHVTHVKGFTINNLSQWLNCTTADIQFQAISWTCTTYWLFVSASMAVVSLPTKPCHRDGAAKSKLQL